MVTAEAAGTGGRTLAVRTALAVRRRGIATAAADGVVADPGVANTAGRIPAPVPVPAAAAAGFTAGRGWAFAGLELGVMPGIPNRSRPATAAGTDPPPWEVRLAGLALCCPGAASAGVAGDVELEVEPGADTEGESSSPGAAAAIPAPDVPANATPRAKAAAPARAPRMLPDIDNP